MDIPRARTWHLRRFSAPWSTNSCATCLQGLRRPSLHKLLEAGSLSFMTTCCRSLLQETLRVLQKMAQKWPLVAGVKRCAVGLRAIQLV